MAFPPFEDEPPFDPYANGAGVPQLPSGFGPGQDPLAQVPEDYGAADEFAFSQDLPPELFQMGADGQMQPLEEQLPSANPPGFSANLAEDLDEDLLTSIGRELVEGITQDIEDRQPWTDRFKRGMEMMGLIPSEMDDGPFPGASTAVHPLISEAVVQFWARAMGELVPSDGPAKAKVIGAQTAEQLGRAERVQTYLNHEMLFIDEGWYPEHSRTLFAVPYQGCAFKKIYHDPSLQRNTSVFVAAEDFIAPAGVTDLKTAPRFTHRIWRTDNEIKKAVAAGMYRDVDLGDTPEEDKPEEAQIKDEISDQEAGEGKDTNRWELFECYCEWELPTDPSDGVALPYVVTVERTTSKVLSIYRGWKAKDQLRRRRVPFVKYSYVPGMGFYDLGLLHLMGGLQQAATGALRVMLDGAATSSLQGGFVAKDANMKDQRLEIEPGVWKPLDATSEELNKAFFSPPFKEPSPALMELLGFLTSRAEKFTATTELMTGETDAKAPVGSTIAVIEQAAKVFSTIHRGLHMAMAQELRLRFELVAEHMPENGYPYDVEGAHEGILAEDFAPGVSIQPVSDPNIFSSAQRVAIAQATYQIVQENGDILDRREGVRRVLEAIRAPDVDKLFISSDPPPPMDPVSEIQALLRGQPVQAYPDQLHEAYLQHYAAFMSNPQFGGNPEVQKQIGPAAMALIGQRLAYAWASAARMLGTPAPLLPPPIQPQAPPNGNMPPPMGGGMPPMGPSGNMGETPPHSFFTNGNGGGSNTAGAQMGPPPPTSAPPELIARKAAEIAPQMAHVAGLPPIEDGKDDTEAKIQIEREKMQLKREDQQATLAFKQDEHKQNMAFEREKFGFEMEREQAKTEAELKKTELQMQTDQQKAELDSQLAVQEAAMTAEQQEQQMVQDQAQAQFDRAQRAQDMTQDRMASDQDRALQREDAAQNRIIRREESKSKQAAQRKPKGNGDGR